jgi:hypothetical protein
MSDSGELKDVEVLRDDVISRADRNAAEWPPKIIKEWIRGGGVNSVKLATELRWWADAFEPAAPVEVLVCPTDHGAPALDTTAKILAYARLLANDPHAPFIDDLRRLFDELDAAGALLGDVPGEGE